MLKPEVIDPGEPVGCFINRANVVSHTDAADLVSRGALGTCAVLFEVLAEIIPDIRNDSPAFGLDSASAKIGVPQAELDQICN